MNMEKKHRRNQNIFKTLTSSQWFLDQCEEIRKKYHESGQDEVLLIREVKKLAKHLPENWEDRIISFIKTQVLVQPEWGTQIVMRDDFNKSSGWERGLYIQVFKDTTIEDIRKIWKHVKDYQNMLPEIAAPYLSEDNLRLYQIWQEVMAMKKRPRNVTRQVSALFSERYRITLDDADIRKRLSETKKQLNAYKKSTKSSLR